MRTANRQLIVDMDTVRMLLLEKKITNEQYLDRIQNLFCTTRSQCTSLKASKAVEVPEKIHMGTSENIIIEGEIIPQTAEHETRHRKTQGQKACGICGYIVSLCRCRK